MLALCHHQNHQDQQAPLHLQLQHHRLFCETQRPTLQAATPQLFHDLSSAYTQQVPLQASSDWLCPRYSSFKPLK